MVTSKDINSAKQKRFFPDSKQMSDKPPLLAMLMVPFILLYIKIDDFIDWIKKKHNDKR